MFTACTNTTRADSGNALRTPWTRSSTCHEPAGHACSALGTLGSSVGRDAMHVPSRCAQVARCCSSTDSNASTKKKKSSLPLLPPSRSLNATERATVASFAGGTLACSQAGAGPHFTCQAIKRWSTIAGQIELEARGWKPAAGMPAMTGQVAGREGGCGLASSVSIQAWPAGQPLGSWLPTLPASTSSRGAVSGPLLSCPRSRLLPPNNLVRYKKLSMPPTTA